MISIVLGTGFGDEGKGQAVHSLSGPGTLVVRFSGGHQCGHTVVTDNSEKHIFSQFGAGTFRGASTYISKYCTVFPTAFVNEYKSLEALHIKFPKFYVHPLAMLTTPYDLAFNRALSMITGHGTCGVGFGTTIQRNEDYHNLYVGDIGNDFIFNTKMNMIKQYYEKKVAALNMSSQISYDNELETAMEGWGESFSFYKNFIKVALFDDITSKYSDFVFEGSQGILLDQHFGFFPHVTRANTTSQNAMDIIKSGSIKDKPVTTYYISRCYQTRHGNGPFSEIQQELINTENESNQENDWQGNLRTAAFDALLVKHSIECDRIYNPNSKRVLILTCFDQLPDKKSFADDLYKSALPAVDKIVLKDSPNWN